MQLNMGMCKFRWEFNVHWWSSQGQKEQLIEHPKIFVNTRKMILQYLHCHKTALQ